MKLVIDIPKERYEDIQRIASVQADRNHFQTVEQIVANGTPIPDNATMLSVTEWADRCRECGSMQGRKLKQIKEKIEQLLELYGYLDYVPLDKVLQIIDHYIRGVSE